MNYIKNILLTFISITFILGSCIDKPDNEINDDVDNPDSKQIQFGNPKKASVLNYNGHVMEPFLSKDGKTLFFNNLNQEPENTNLHFAKKINDSTFQYKGEIKGVNTAFLEGVSTIDSLDNIYFVSTRSYGQTLSSIYKGKLINDSITNIQLVSGISKNTGGWINFDVEVSKNGENIYFADGRFDEKGGPYESNIVLAIKQVNEFIRTEENYLDSINTTNLEYAACISSNMLELYFTRMMLPITESSEPGIFAATRKTISEPFNKPYKINEITGFAEAPTISPDDKTIYFHKKVNDLFTLYYIKKEAN